MDQKGETPHQNYRRQFTSPPSLLENKADVLVVGVVLLFGFELVLYGLVLSTVCGPLWQIRPICRQHLYVYLLSFLQMRMTTYMS